MRVFRKEAEKKVRVLNWETCINHVTEAQRDLRVLRNHWGIVPCGVKGLCGPSGSSVQGCRGRTGVISLGYALIRALSNQ